MRRRRRPTAWQIVVALVAAVAGGHVLYVMLPVTAGVTVPYGLTDAMILAAFAARWVTRATREPSEPDGQPVVAPRVEVERPDRPFTGARHWSDRLSWTEDDPVAFNRTVRPAVLAVADERMRQRHGVRLAEGDRALALLPVPLRYLAARPVDASPTPRQMTEIVRALEEL